MSTTTRRGTVLSLVLALLATLGFGVLAPQPAHGATERLLVQVQGSYGDALRRAHKSGIIVGATATQQAGGRQPFNFNVTCARPNGTECPPDATITWDFGDGTTDSWVLTDRTGDARWQTSHVYDTPGSYTVRVTVAYSQGHGSGSGRVLVGPRFVDVDAVTVDQDGTPAKAIPPLAEAVWAVTALGLMGPCAPYYRGGGYYDPTTGSGTLTVDKNRAVFCGAPAAQGPSTPAHSDATNPIGRQRFALEDLPSGWSAMEDCLAYYATCGLPASAFTIKTSDPTAACDEGCRTVLENAGVLRPDGHMTYNPARCADNLRAPLDAAAVTGATTLEPGVEPGCATRGDFIRALTRAVDLRNEVAHSDHPLLLGGDGGNCPDAPGPDALDGVRRGAMLLSTSSLTVDPCHPDAALTKGEAYRLLAALLGVTASPGYQETSPLADLVDLSLGHGPGQAYPGSAAVLAVLEDGAPLVGSSACPVTPTDPSRPACFNPYEALTRADVARLLAHYILGDTSDTAALSATLTASTDRIKLGGTAQLQVEVSVPVWLRPYTSTWQVRLERDAVTPPGSLTPNDLTFTGCEGTIRDAALAAGPFTATCTIGLRRADENALVPLALYLGGTKMDDVPLYAEIVAPLVLPTTTSPGMVEDGGTFTSELVFTDNTGPRVGVAQVSHRPDAGWSDLATDTTGRATVRVTEIPGALDNSVTLAWTPTRDAFTDPTDPNDAVVLYARVCSTAQVCSPPYLLRERIAPVNDAPVAFTITPGTFNGQSVPVAGDCTQFNRTNLGPNMFALAGNDPRDGRDGFNEGITGYSLHAEADAPGSLYYCASTGQWTKVAAPTPAGGVPASEVVLWNPPTTQVTNNTAYTFTVSDDGIGSGTPTSAPAPIVLNSNAPGAAPVITSLSITPSTGTGPAWTTDFTVNATASYSGGGVTLSRYDIDFGDGVTASTAPVPGTEAGVLTHRYPEHGTYTVKVSATDSKGRTSPQLTQTITVQPNYVGDPTFETGVDHWSATNTGQVVLSPIQTTYSYDPATGQPAPDRPGRQAALVTRVPQGGVNSSPCLVTHTPPALVNKVKAGTSYTFSLWVRPVTGTRGHQFTLTVEELDDGSVLPSARTQAFTLPASDTTWQQVSVTYPATRDGSELRLTAGLPTHSGTGTDAACFAMDDAALH